MTPEQERDTAQAEFNKAVTEFIGHQVGMNAALRKTIDDTLDGLQMLAKIVADHAGRVGR